ncbi:MAG: LUD domain-containing protein [Actinomycetota bacterium]|nr:LUD domain-containing protein [Actinomycetota bacterium]
MSDARAEILARIDRALGVRPAPSPVERHYRTAGSVFLPPEALLEQLVERLVDYRASVRWARPSTLAGTVAVALAERGVRRLVVPAGFPAAWLAPARDVAQVGDEPPLSPYDLDRTDGVVTTCAVAIAETGTLVLDAGAGQGRRALTLVPDYHLVVVAVDDVVPTVPDAIARLDPTRPLTWISGPSATSDIELDRVEGVHGPRTLEVLVVEEGDAGAA